MGLWRNTTAGNAPPKAQWKSQSGMARFNVKIAEEQDEMVEQNVKFTDLNPSHLYEVPSEFDETRSSTDIADAPIENFFSRPLKIAQYEWSTSINTFSETFNPWRLYFENPRVLNRMANYNLLRSKLHIKVLLNGNGFHYGRLIMSYIPLESEDKFTRIRPFFTQDIIGASQRPHVYLDPTTSQGGSMVLPFFWPKNSLSIPFGDWKNMGELTLSTLVPLKHANGADDQVTISVFAWAEDVHMSIPTSVGPVGLAPQSGFSSQSKDEYTKDGAISQPASTIARIAGMLSMAPVIGPFAKATEMAATAVGNIAKVFGYSRPAVLSDIGSYKPIIMGNLANTNTPENLMKLSMDVKQELTIDPRTTGLSGIDELDIKSIACRESYLTQFDWAVGFPAEDVLFEAAVTPCLWDLLSVPPVVETHMPACCFAATPFEFWRGSMKFRFQIVSSTFHKGRLKIVWDPVAHNTNEYNTNYTQIIDIAEDKDFTVEIGWGQEVSYLRTKQPGSEPGSFFDAGSGGYVPEFGTANGVIAVYVVNELTVPSSAVNNDIVINVFVSAGDDFEVAAPNSRNLENLTWFSQSGSAPLMPDAEATQENSAPMQEEVLNAMGPTQSTSDHMLAVHFGEAIPSFRQCLKRYAFHRTIITQGNGLVSKKVITPDLPFHRGFAPGAIDPITGQDNYNFCKMTLLTYLMPAYVGYRGSLRWKYQNVGGVRSDGTMSATRFRPSEAPVYSESEVAFSGDSSDVGLKAFFDSRLPDSWNGTAVTVTSVNPALEIELPFYENFRFLSTKRKNITSDTSGFPLYLADQSHFHTLDMTVRATTAFPVRTDAYNAVGEDFNLFFFLGAPVIYNRPTVPVP